MAQASDDARFTAKLIKVAAFQARSQNFDGGVGIQVDMHAKKVTITVDLSAGPHAATISTTDLTAAYVHENSAYST